MTLTEQIMNHVQKLPKSAQQEVLNFVDYLEAKDKGINNQVSEWTNSSIAQAMRGMESEQSLYSLDDIKEKV